jgi:hypothetical protein
MCESVLGAHGFAARRGALAHGAVVERRFDRNGGRIRGHGAVWQRLPGEAARGKEAGLGELVNNERRDNGGLAGSQRGICRAGRAVVDDGRRAGAVKANKYRPFSASELAEVGGDS